MDNTLVVVNHVCYNDYAIHHHHRLSLHFRCFHLFWYISLLSLILISLPFIDGSIWSHTAKPVGDCEEVNAGDDVMMEVDLRGEGRERTLHFFIEGRQQKIYFYNLPSTVEFCVWHDYFILVELFSHSFSSSLLFFSSVLSLLG